MKKNVPVPVLIGLALVLVVALGFALFREFGRDSTQLKPDDYQSDPKPITGGAAPQ